MGYKNFDLAVYVTVHDINKLTDMNELEKKFAFFEKHLKLSKVYLETYRSSVEVDRDKMLQVKEFFEKKGIKTSGGITTAKMTPKGYGMFCYTGQEDTKKLRDMVEFTARIFDELILDDFYFTHCKCDACIAAKGDRTWTEYRLDLMKRVSLECVINPAKKINPNINLIIKYPNWYDNYQSTGYNLEDEPKLFDMIYTGTETRDPEYTQQHLQRYLSYFIMRYMENVLPGKNGGGWFDAYDCYNLTHYVEQAHLTLFSKAREVTMFCFGLLQDTIFVPMAGYTLDRVDEFLGLLGNPVGIPCYKPYHSSGEDHLYDYLGMLGLPLEPFPEFPTGGGGVLLTASAAKDGEIIDKIKGQLKAGKTVVITSGLLKALESRGIEDIAQFKYTDKKVTVDRFACLPYDCAFKNYYAAPEKVLLPVIEFSINDATPVIAGLCGNNNVPVVLSTEYGEGKLVLLTIPDNCNDLYNFPREVLSYLRENFIKDFGVTIDAESKVGLFTYDNDTFVIESFLPYYSDVKVIVNREGAVLTELTSGREITGVSTKGRTVFEITLRPATYRVYKYK